MLFQAFNSLLKKSQHPMFVLIGSPNGSIGGMEKYPYPTFAYGASKAMAHYIVRKIHFEDGDINAFALDPGYVELCFGNVKMLALMYVGSFKRTWAILVHEKWAWQRLP